MDTDIPVFVIGEDGNAKDIFAAVSFGTNTVRISQSFDDYNSEDIVIIDGGWIGKNNRSDIWKHMDLLIGDGIVVSVTGSYDVFVDNPNSVFAAFVDGCHAYAVHNDLSSSRYVCHSADGSDMQECVTETYCWAHRILSAKQLRNASDLTCGTEYSSDYSGYLDGYGYMNIETNYYAIPEDDERYNYYFARYYEESVPNHNRFTADMYVESNNAQNNLIYSYTAPGTVSNVSTAYISYGVEIGIPPSTTYNVGWSYSVQDVAVHNGSDTETGTYDIWHNVDELKAVGQGMYHVEPAKFMRADCYNGSGHCYQSDVYTVKFCKWVAFWLEFHEITKTLHVYYKGLPHTLTIDPNGAEEYEDLEMTIELGAPEPDSSTYSEGTFVSLWDRGYYRSGYTCIGYSTNPNSTIAEYNFNDTIQMLDDYILYAVWMHD
ncbi:MAG: hypothetical protein IKP20_07205 [Candidatus Methanomethylophilaceae archaeon]|nr:hypothetical protein [Candidatus Methanomethylophilaceae archaeon]